MAIVANKVSNVHTFSVYVPYALKWRSEQHCSGAHSWQSNHRVDLAKKMVENWQGADITGGRSLKVLKWKLSMRYIESKSGSDHRSKEEKNG